MRRRWLGWRGLIRHVCPDRVPITHHGGDWNLSRRSFPLDSEREFEQSRSTLSPRLAAFKIVVNLHRSKRMQWTSSSANIDVHDAERSPAGTWNVFPSVCTGTILGDFRTEAGKNSMHVPPDNSQGWYSGPHSHLKSWPQNFFCVGKFQRESTKA